LSVGSEFPKGVKFTYIPYSEENADVKACGFPIQLDLDKELSGKKVIIVAVPGAFTPTCMVNHIPPFGRRLSDLKSKGVDDVIVISANDPFVLSAWGKVLGLDGKIKFASDPNASFSQSVGLSFDGTAKGMGIRTTRYAAVVDNGKVTYLGVEENPGVATVSGADAVISKL
ncbi:peroxiredoxin, partial [Macrococcus caseolyticus]